VVTGHKLAWQTSDVSGSGDHTADESGTAYDKEVGSWYLVESAVVTAPKQQVTVVAFGDSITDGDKSTPGRTCAIPPARASPAGPAQAPPVRRHAAGHLGQPRPRRRAGGRRADLLRSLPAEPARRRDGDPAPGVNDLRWEFATKPEDLTNAYQQLIDRAHVKGVCVVGGTILPWEGGSLWRAPKDAIREQVNTWIRTSGAFGAVVDFDAVMRDPQQPARMVPAYDSGDHLHPGDAGYAAMANAVNLKDLTCRR
jgi:lysophospholipase L1-like esterase